ncbi:TBC1 domain family member 5 homolog A [Linum perenne]
MPESAPPLPPTTTNSLPHSSSPYANLRGVQWRVDLGILPSHPSSSFDVLRRVTADSRRRYASLRRHLLVDPHLPKDGSSSLDVVIDNPLSQNPDSTWGRFFRNAELEKTVDQDLSRLYPEHGSYFQTPGCQGMLRRILLLWCLRHPEYGYRQGMHELLAPLLYVLHVDVKRLSEVRTEYEDYFTDKFDGISFDGNNLSYNFDFKKLMDSMEEESDIQGNTAKVSSLDDLDTEIQTIIYLSDAYGAEGELGIVLSEKFMEHDAYCMFDALMNGAQGSVAITDFFTISPVAGSFSGLPPVIEASTALYHLLSVVDSSLHSHLVELGVEPQYFSLRWLRVLFGREFTLEDLLLIWDEIFAADNKKLCSDANSDGTLCYNIFTSSRGALISGMAVAMILHLRSSLLATENATTCLQRLLNFPESVDLGKLIEKAKSLQVLALDFHRICPSPSFGGDYNHSKPKISRSHTLSSDSISSITPLTKVPDSYWEERWRVMHKAAEVKHHSLEKQNKIASQKKGWSEKLRFSLSRTESDPSPANIGIHKKGNKSSVRRNLLKDLSRELGLDEDDVNVVHNNNSDPKECQPAGIKVGDSVDESFDCITEERCLRGNAGSEENSPAFSEPSSPHSGANNHENGSEKSSVGSNSSIDQHDDHHPEATRNDVVLPVSLHPSEITLVCGSKNARTEKPPTGTKKLLSSKLQWFWKFGKSSIDEEAIEKGRNKAEVTKPDTEDDVLLGASSADVSFHSYESARGDTVEPNVRGNLRDLGQSMVEHIQVIEAVLQQPEGGSMENLSRNKDQLREALKELRKISNSLSEM